MPVPDRVPAVMVPRNRKHRVQSRKRTTNHPLTSFGIGLMAVSRDSIVSLTVW